MSADFVYVRVALRSASVCRVKALGRPGVALARSARLFGIVVTSRGPGTLHVLSIPYEPSGNEVISSGELRSRLSKYMDKNLAEKPNVKAHKLLPMSHPWVKQAGLVCLKAQSAPHIPGNQPHATFLLKCLSCT